MESDAANADEDNEDNAKDPAEEGQGCIFGRGFGRSWRVCEWRWRGGNGKGRG